MDYLWNLEEPGRGVVLGVQIGFQRTLPGLVGLVTSDCRQDSVMNEVKDVAFIRVQVAL